MGSSEELLLLLLCSAVDSLLDSLFSNVAVWDDDGDEGELGTCEEGMILEVVVVVRTLFGKSPMNLK